MNWDEKAEEYVRANLTEMPSGFSADQVRALARLVIAGARWAVYQEPTDAEVEAADKAFHEVIMSGEWVTQEQAIRAALIAAQKVRAGL